MAVVSTMCYSTQITHIIPITKIMQGVKHQRLHQCTTKSFQFITGPSDLANLAHILLRLLHITPITRIILLVEITKMTVREVGPHEVDHSADSDDHSNH